MTIEEIYKPKGIKSFKDHIKGYDKVDNREMSWTGTLPELFAKYGFAPAGNGKYGSVFVNPKYPYAIKVFMRDTAYLTYLNFVMKNQRNRFVPKTKGKVVKIGKVFMAIRLEKLSYQANNQKMRDFFILCRDPEDYLDGYFNLPTIPSGDEDGVNLAEFLMKHRRLMDIHEGNIMNRKNGDPVLIDPLYNWYKGDRFTIDPDDISGFKDIF